MGAILSVLTSPKQTFEKIREHGGAFAIPFIFLLVVSVLVFLLQIPLVEHTLDSVEQPVEGLDSEALRTVSLIIGFVGSLIGVVISVFITALLLQLVNLIVRGDAKYMQLVKVAVLSYMPNLIHGILIGVLSRTMDPASASKISFSLAAFVEQDTGFAYLFASIFNPFGLWGLGIMVIGTAVMARKSVRSTAVWIIGGWFVINVLFAGLGGLFQ